MTDKPLAETTDIEYKSQVERSKPKSWLKTVSAFANTAGGTVVFGIDDDTHERTDIADPQDTQQVRDGKRLVDSLPGNATQQVTQQVSSLLNILGDQELSSKELMDAMQLADRNNFTKNYLNPALEAGLVERTIPDKPRSSKQKYRRSSHS